MEKHRFSSISLTVRDRAISLKFSTHRVSQQTTLCNFPNIFIPLNLLLISLTVQDRAILSILSTHSESQQTTLCNFHKKSPLPLKMVAILNCQIFAKNPKTHICFYLLNCVR